MEHKIIDFNNSPVKSSKIQFNHKLTTFKRCKMIQKSYFTGFFNDYLNCFDSSHSEISHHLTK